MSNEKRNIETEEIKEARQLSEEELEKVTGGGSATLEVASEVAQAIFGAEQMDIDATEALQGKYAGVVVTTLAGQPCAGEDIRDR
ncbi:MAG: hypothetical protein Q4A04_09835 [Eubacteriales bacterium]|nr:hypothetical protein [Eubacteriales bacterium]